MELICCEPNCGKPAEFEVMSEPDGKRADYDRYVHACEAHVGALLESGVSAVYPVGTGG